MIYTNGIGGADWADTPMTFITAQLALGNQFDPEQHCAHFYAVLDCAAEVPLFPSKPGHHLPLKDADSSRSRGARGGSRSAACTASRGVGVLRQRGVAICSLCCAVIWR